MYSQNQEEKFILEYFKDKKGTFLDIGAYDGVDLSNTRALSDLGWGGVCIEPNPTVYHKLCENNFGRAVLNYQLAIGTKNERVEMMMNSTYYSTLKKSEMDRWRGTKFDFNPVLVDCFTFDKFIEVTGHTEFNFISIDCEGVDFEVLSQIDLNKFNTQMVCVETNGKENQKYIEQINKFGRFYLIHQNAENIILAR